jgi:TM2 domain-containing membrane protein YozV
MSDEFPTSKPRPRLEITFDDLGAAPEAPTAALPPALPPLTGKVQQPASPSTAIPPQYPPPQPTYPPPQYPSGPNPGLAAVALAIGHKSTGVAVLLSLLLTGAGQVYCGRVGRGVAFFCGAVFSWITLFFLIGFLLLPAVVIWAAVDAASLANRHNAMLVASLSEQPRYG